MTDGKIEDAEFMHENNTITRIEDGASRGNGDKLYKTRFCPARDDNFFSNPAKIALTRHRAMLDGSFYCCLLTSTAKFDISTVYYVNTSHSRFRFIVCFFVI